MIKKILITLILSLGGQKVLADLTIRYCEKPTPTACMQATSVAKQDFFVCTQYETTDNCFNNHVLKVKPKDACKEFTEECIQMCELTSSTNSQCQTYCK